MKKFLNYVLVYISLILLFSVLMIITYCLPNGRIRYHVAESIPLLESEGNGYNAFFDQPGSLLDVDTDTLILNAAMNKGMNNSCIKNAFENSFYADFKNTGVNLLKEAVNENVVNNYEYSRYWHGIQIFIRPLLMFFNYSEIRYILMLVIFVLLGIVFSLLSKELGMSYSIIFAITISFMYIVLIPVSLQYSSIFIVSLFSIIATILLYKFKKDEYFGILFFVIGAVSTFFDLLTYPLVTLGFPVVIAALLQNSKENSLIKQMLNILKYGVLWALGYSLTFFAKWIVASIVLNKDVITSSINQLLFRVNGNEVYTVSRLDTLKGNFNTFFVPIAKFVMICLGMIWIILYNFIRKDIKECKCVISLLCIAIVPYMWYLVFAGHSSIHSWFTNRIQAVTVFAILSAMAYTLDFSKILRRIK